MNNAHTTYLMKKFTDQIEEDLTELFKKMSIEFDIPKEKIEDYYSTFFNKKMDEETPKSAKKEKTKKQTPKIVKILKEEEQCIENTKSGERCKRKKLAESDMCSSHLKQKNTDTPSKIQKNSSKQVGKNDEKFSATKAPESYYIGKDDEEEEEIHEVSHPDINELIDSIQG